MQIARIHVDCWRVNCAHLFPDPPSGEEMQEHWRHLLTGQVAGLTVLVADGPRELDGFVCAGPARDDCFDLPWEAYACYVRPGCQRRGVGRSLFAALLARLARRGIYELYLWAPQANEAARAFFTGLGGEWIGEAEGPDGIREDGWYFAPFLPDGQARRRPAPDPESG